MRRLPWFLLLLASGLAAHPVHTTLAEVNWNAGAQRLEFALRMDREDLETLVAQAETAGEEAQAGDRLAAAVTSRLGVKTDSGRALPANWIGLEPEALRVWLYFEVSVTDESCRLELYNRLLLEEHPRQLNTVRLQLGSQVRSLQLHRDRPSLRLTLPDCGEAAGRGEERSEP